MSEPEGTPATFAFILVRKFGRDGQRLPGPSTDVLAVAVTLERAQEFAEKDFERYARFLPDEGGLSSWTAFPVFGRHGEPADETDFWVSGSRAINYFIYRREMLADARSPGPALPFLPE
jgi:hypothetical protein